MSAIGNAVAPLYVPFGQPVEPWGQPVEPWPGDGLLVQQAPIPFEQPPGLAPFTAYPPIGPGQGKEPPTEPPPHFPPLGSAGPGQELPPGPPPNVPPPGQGPVLVPGGPPVPTEPPTQTEPVEPPPGDGDGSSSKTARLIGAGILGAGAAGIAGVAAYRTGARNVHAVKALAAAVESGAVPQGGLQSINDARLGARVAKGLGTNDYIAVALPGVNRVGSHARLVAVARGHLDHAELLASSTALRGSGDVASVHEPLRRHVLSELEGGRSLPAVLDDLDRYAGGTKAALGNEQLARYWNDTSIVEYGPRTGGRHVTSGVDVTRPELALGEGRELVETGREARLNQLVAGRDADLGGAGLADGVGTIQGVGVSRLHPKMQQYNIALSGVDPKLVEEVGLNAAYSQRWADRLAAGAAQ